MLDVISFFHFETKIFGSCFKLLDQFNKHPKITKLTLNLSHNQTYEAATRVFHVNERQNSLKKI